MKAITGRVRKIMKNESLNRVFRRMMGIDEINPDIISSKFDNMKSHMQKFLSLLENINESGVLDEDITPYIISAREEMDTLSISPNSLKYISDLRHVNEIEDVNERKAKLAEIIHNTLYDPEELRVVYNKLINCNLFKQMISFVSKYSLQLKAQRKETGAKNDILDGSFIIKQNRLQFLEFIDIDFRKFFVGVTDEECMLYIQRWLKSIYKYCEKMLNEHCRPNIYPSEYIEVILESIKVARKSISRCNAAFNMMERLVGNFEKNFDKYYKRYVISGNPYIILEYYIKDVANEVKDSSPDIKRQFRTIMQHFSKKVSEIPKADNDIREVINLTSALDLEENSEDFSEEEK